MRNTHTISDRPLTAGRVRALLVLIGAGALASAALPVRAEEPVPAGEIDAATQLHAQRIAGTVCGTCHGTQGNSTQPKFPRLAGQNPSYLATQLKAFRSQVRGDPDALGYMWGMAAELESPLLPG